jgi:4-hydroxy-tetrahydrodipicolinate synthase
MATTGFDRLNMSIFKGSMVAIATPMNVDGSLDFDSLDNLIEFHVENKTDVIISVGTTGESATLDFEEHSKVIKTTIEIVKGRIPVIAGTGANSTSEAIELTESAKKNGADGCLLVTPYYNKPTQEGLFQHYKKIGDAVAIPQILYNVPGRTSVDMLPETVQRLSTHNNIIGIKEASGNKDRSIQLMKLCSENIQIFTGDDKTSMSDIIDGFSGNISVTANVAPLEMHKMCKYAIEGDLEKATEINSKIEALHDILFCESNPIPVKWCLNKMGLIKKGIRLPLTWMDEKYDESLNNALIKTGILNE